MYAYIILFFKVSRASFRVWNKASNFDGTALGRKEKKTINLLAWIDGASTAAILRTFAVPHVRGRAVCLALTHQLQFVG